MKSKHKIIAVIVIAAALIGYWLYLQFNKAMEYTYKFSSLKFDAFGLKRTAGTLGLKIMNFSSLSGSLIAANLKMYVNDVFVSNLIVTDPVQILGKKEFFLPLKFDFVPNQILSISNIFALDGIANPDKMMVGFKGTVKVKKGFFTVNIPIDINEPYSWYI